MPLLFLSFLSKGEELQRLGLFFFSFAFAFVFVFPEMQSDRSDSSGPITQRVNSLPSPADTRGKHRIQAELKRLEQDARFLEEELEQLDRIEKASASCNEMLSNVESRPDPLLPITNGPLNPLWDRWFESAQESQGCRCWLL